MLNVNNRRIIARLSARTFAASKLRNLMAGCAIALTAMLFTILFTLGIGSADALQQAAMRQSGSSSHGMVKYMDDASFEKISSHPLIREISYTRVLCDSVDNPELLKRQGELWYLDDAGLKRRFCEPVAGSRPVAANEIMMDTQTMQLLGLPEEIGTGVRLALTVKGRQVERDFVLSGWWESDPAFQTSVLVTSRAYMDTWSEELVLTDQDDFSLSGVINGEIMFDNTFRMGEKLNRVITESGFNPEDADAANYLESNVNWAYLSAGMTGDPVTMAAMLAAALLIMLTGYLIIYNIFQISVLRDIRYYGLLKTIGTTGRQIRRMIHRQAAALSLTGIPAGLLLGFVTGSGLVPMVLARTYYADSQVEMSANPLIFAGSAVFTAVTVWISACRPGWIAGKASPIEAVRYTGMDQGYQKHREKKRRTNGGKLYQMALSNLGRNKKRTALVLLSLSLSLALLNCVFTLSRSLDREKYLSKFIGADFLIAHADYFKSQYNSWKNAVEKRVIEDMEAQPGFREGGRIYQTSLEYFTAEDPDYTETYNVGQDGNPLADVYGLDDFWLTDMEVVEGELDAEKLKAGGYLLAGVPVDDFDHPRKELLHFHAGDKVILHNYRMTSPGQEEREYTTQEYEVMAVVKVNHYTKSVRRRSEYSFYLPSNIYLPLTYEKTVMSYAFDVTEDKIKETEDFLADYTKRKQPLMNYESKQVYLREFEGMNRLLLSVGGILSGIIAFIGILNFLNVMLTGILTRRREFAVMQSIGMTRKQLTCLLCLEGACYAVGTALLSLVLGILGSFCIIRNLVEGFWFMSFRFVLFPIMVCWPFFLVLSVLVPGIALGSIRRSVTERLREAE